MSTVRVTFDTLRPTANATIKVWASADTSQPIIGSSPTLSTQDQGGYNLGQGIATFSGLATGAYAYVGIDFGGGVLSSSLRKFRVPPVRGQRVAQTSWLLACALVNAGYAPTIVTRIVASAPDLVFLQGDDGYGDNTIIDVPYSATLQRKSSQSTLDLTKQVAQHMTMGQNHDRIWAAGTFENNSPDGVPSVDIMRSTGPIWKNRTAHGALWFPNDTLCMSYDYCYGSVLYLVPDMVCHRSESLAVMFGNDPAVFGVDHYAKLKQVIAQADADKIDFILFGGSGSIIATKYEAWSLIAPAQYADFLNFLGTLTHSQFIFWEGDDHMTGIDDGTYTTLPYAPRVRIPRFNCSGVLRTGLDPFGGFQWNGTPNTYKGTGPVPLTEGSCGLQFQTDYSTGKPRAHIQMWGRNTGDPADTLLWDKWSDDIPVNIQWAAASASGQAGTTISVDLARSGHGPVGGATALATQSWGGSSTVGVNPNAALQAASILLPGTPGTYFNDLSGPGTYNGLGAQTRLTLTVT